MKINDTDAVQKTMLKKPIKTYDAGYPQAEKELYEKFYSCESYHIACPECNGTCNTFLKDAKR